ncbi:hypothetical protein M514_24010 [Trichuris suis]|uniref:DDE-1 domain-containing protein n=1 Tax=Trichuris suis TaxID=68888 RepID=A0A085N316_9BILA|nr:hypothetical protein M514_24010 [Trichuris suis]
MDQGVIRSVKGLYRKNLLQELLINDDNSAESVTASYERISLRDCCYVAAASWESVKQTTLRNSWNKVLGGSETGADGGRDDGVEIEEISTMLRIISICGECESSEVERWLGCNSEDRGFQMMNDEEIVEFVLNKALTKEDEEQQGEEKAGPSTIPSNNAALQYLEQALRWYEAQGECDRHRLFCLKSVRSLAAQKCQTAQKQT